MIRLEFGQNLVAVTLTEKVTLPSPFFLFAFENCQGKTFFYCTALDTSSYPERFNKFSLTVVSGTPDANAGELKLEIGGQYNYTVYEQEDADNLDPDNAEGIVETGIMIYDLEKNDRAEYNIATTRKVYEGPS